MDAITRLSRQLGNAFNRVQACEADPSSVLIEYVEIDGRTPQDDNFFCGLGSSGNLDDVEPYYRDIRGGQTPAPEAVTELTERYRCVGGKTPLLEITRLVADKLEQRLNQGSDDSRWRAYVGMKHWHPYIADTMDAIAAEGRTHIVSAPFGFVCDHLEILYDIDIEARKRATDLGIDLSRIVMPNDDPEFIEVLHDLIVSGAGARIADLST